MATKQSDKQNNTAAEPDSSLSSSLAEITSDTSSIDSLNQQIADLRELTHSLVTAVNSINEQKTRNTVLQDTIAEFRADVNAAKRAILLAPAANAAVPSPTPIEQGRKCSPCDCVNDGCCCFEIVISQVRASKPQIEPADAGDAGPLINAMEVQMYFTVDSIGFLWPGLATTMDLRADGLPGGPGPWVVIERPVNRICIPKGTTVTKQLRVEVREHDEGVERPIGMKDELGEALGVITLDCCMSTIYPAMPVDISLDKGGEGRGMVQAAFYARRVCC